MSNNESVVSFAFARRATEMYLSFTRISKRIDRIRHWLFRLEPVPIHEILSAVGRHHPFRLQLNIMSVVLVLVGSCGGDLTSSSQHLIL
jgi:hypothetical protein